MIKDDRWLILIDQWWMNAWLQLSRLLQCALCHIAVCSVPIVHCSLQCAY